MLEDTNIVDWLYRNLEWGGSGWWLPDICIKEGCKYEDYPSKQEFYEYLNKLMGGKGEKNV